MANKASLDTQILIWGLKKQASSDRKHKIEAASAFLESLEKTNSKIFISSVVLGELLCDLPAEQRRNLSKEIRKRFMVLPFDAASSLEYADIFYNKKIAPPKTGNLDGIGRKHIKPDMMIVASSVSAGMSVLYTEDEPLQKVADGIIPVYPMYKVDSQLSLLDQQVHADPDEDE